MKMDIIGLIGHIDDVIKSSGYRIGPFEVESAVMTHPAVVECAVTGVPDEVRGQAVKATIVLAKDYKDSRRASDKRDSESCEKRDGSIQISSCDRICGRVA